MMSGMVRIHTLSKNSLIPTTKPLHKDYHQPDTEVNTILRRVSPDFPEKVASVINHTYHNKQVVQLISSQIDCDRMDYLLRDSYYSGANYGQFDLNRILRVIRPTEDGIVLNTMACTPLRTILSVVSKCICKCIFTLLVAEWKYCYKIF